MVCSLPHFVLFPFRSVIDCKNSVCTPEKKMFLDEKTAYETNRKVSVTIFCLYMKRYSYFCKNQINVILNIQTKKIS